MTDPNTRWEDVGGLQHVKKRLRDLVERPLRSPELFDQLNLTANMGLLLYGPPGTGKTLLAKAIATEVGVNFIAVQGPELFSQWLGESEEAVRRVFRTAQRAAPSIIFFDQLDAIVPRRGDGRDTSGSQAPQRVLNQILAELDGMEPRAGVIVIGATNNLANVDPAALRPGRFGVHLFVGLPEAADRAEILRIHLGETALAAGTTIERVIDHLVEETSGYSGADIAFLCQMAKFHALERAEVGAKLALELGDFEVAMRELNASR